MVTDLLTSTPWQRLGIAATNDESTIRKAYAALIRTYRPDSHPTEFSQIREAYEQALQIAPFVVGLVGSDEPQSKISVEQAAEPLSGTLAEAPALPVFTQAPPSVSALQTLMSEGAKAEGQAALLLVAHLDELDHASIDARMDYERELIRWLAWDASAPLVLCCTAARRFGWLAQYDNLRRDFGDHAIDMLSQRVERGFGAGYIDLNAIGKSVSIPQNQVQQIRIDNQVFWRHWIDTSTQYKRIEIGSTQDNVDPPLKDVWDALPMRGMVNFLKRRSRAFWLYFFVPVIVVLILFLTGGIKPEPMRPAAEREQQILLSYVAQLHCAS